MLAKLAEAGAIDRVERVVAIITGEGLKTLDAVREGFEIDEIEPSLASFEAGVEAGRGRRRLGASGSRFPPRWRSRSRSPRSCAPPPDGEDELEVDGATVGEALDAVFDAYADLRERITEDGTLRRFVNVYVSGEDIRFQDGLDTALSDGDEVTILPAVAGGCVTRTPRTSRSRSSAGGAARGSRSTRTRSRRRWSRSAASRSSGT